MNKIIRLSLILLFGISTMTLSAQSAAASKAVPEKYIPTEGWHSLLEEAYKESKKTGKPIMANFTGKKWCGWCKRLTASVFDKQDFKTWSDKNVVLLELDYPRRSPMPLDVREQNANMQRAFQVRGFPTVWVFDIDKDENGQWEISALGKTGYKKTVKEFTEGVDQMIAKRGGTGEPK